MGLSAANLQVYARETGNIFQLFLTNPGKPVELNLRSSSAKKQT